jgi:hypothetical protein
LLSDAASIVATWIDDPNPSDEDGFGGDHLNKALNTMRPVAVLTLIRIARAAKLAPSEKFDSEPVITAVQEALHGRLLPRDASLAVSSAFGEGLSLMMWMDAPWTNSWLPSATTADAWGDVFVTTALTTNTTSTQLLNDLWPSIDAILDRTAASESVEMGWRSDRSIDEVVGDHLMTLAMWGAASPWPGRTESYFARVSTEAAASVLGHVGWRLMNTAEPPRELVERAEAIWDARQVAVDGYVLHARRLEITGLLPAPMTSAWPIGMRVIVRREHPHPGAQLSLFEVADGWRYQAFATNTTAGQVAFLEARHRAHARVEDRIRVAKDTGLGRFPSREYDINTAWLIAVTIAADLIAWLALIALPDTLKACEPKALRYRFMHVPARLTRGARGSAKSGLGTLTCGFAVVRV